LTEKLAKEKAEAEAKLKADKLASEKTIAEEKKEHDKVKAELEKTIADAKAAEAKK